LLQIAKRHPCVLSNPEPMAYFMEFGASSLNFELQVFIDFRDNRLKVRDELQVEVQRIFAEKDFVIAFPQMDIHVKAEALAEREMVGGQA
jgi:potassium efflux system protein